MKTQVDAVHYSSLAYMYVCKCLYVYVDITLTLTLLELSIFTQYSTQFGASYAPAGQISFHLPYSCFFLSLLLLRHCYINNC